MTRVLVIPHSAPAAVRAHQLFDGYDGAQILQPRVAPRAVARELRDAEALYAIDIGTTTVFAIAAARARRVPVVLDTGDLVYELERSIGRRSRTGLAAVWAGERFALRAAARLVVRGHAHLSLVQRQATFAPDLAPPGARRVDARMLRRSLDLGNAFVLGLVGSMRWAPRLELAYGWDVIEAVASAPPHVQAVLVGDGDARPWLETRARKLGVTDRCRFVGHVPIERVHEYVSAMDAAVSTQTNDRIGAVRTTGKLPLYLACGTPVLASDVGEARLLLGPLGWTIRYDGVVDRSYPKRLAAKVAEWAADPEGAAGRAAAALAIHRDAFDASVVRTRVHHVIDEIRRRRA